MSFKNLKSGQNMHEKARDAMIFPKTPEGNEN